MYHKPTRNVDVPNTDLLTWVFQNGKKHDTNQALYIDALDPSRRLTFAQARKAIRAMIKGLRSLGVGKGSVVCLHSFNIYYPLIFLSVIGAGAVFVGSNPGYKELELTNLLETSRASLIITAPDLLPLVQTVVNKLSISTSRVLVFDRASQTPSGFRSWEELFHHGEEAWIEFDDSRRARETPACLVTTSGTTGLPKMAVLSHHAWVALNCVVDDPDPKPYHIKRLIFLPMFHTFAAPLSHLAPLREGHTTYIMPRYSMNQLVNAVERFGINELMVVPPIIVNLVTMAGSKAFLKHVRFIWCGGAPLDGAIMKRMYRSLAEDACIAQVYGMTEAGWISTLKWPERDDSGSVGRLLPNVEAKLINDQGAFVLEPGVRGEICVRGPRLMNGYLGNAKATKETFIDEWLKTGDIGTIDKAGRIYIVDRQKDLIKVRGWQVSPAELEGILRAHPQIVDAAVIGVKHNNSEAPKAFVVRVDVSLTEEAVKEYIASLLVSYKHLAGGVEFLETIPRSPSGKILRKLL